MSMDEFEATLEDIKPVRDESDFVLEAKKPNITSLVINEQASSEKKSSRSSVITSIMNKM
jgi:hypothetical protein